MTEESQLDELVNKIYESTKRIKGDMELGKVLDLKNIKELVEPIINLIKEAKEKKMYIYIQPVNKWVSPNEFEKKIHDGWYIYHISSLELKNPVERLEEMDKELLDKRKQFNKVLKEIALYLGIDEKELEITALKKVMIKEKAEYVNNESDMD